MKNRLNDDIAFWHWTRARQARGGQSWSSYWKTHSPSALLLTVLSDTSVRLDWTNTGLGFTGHSIERSADGATWAEIDTVAIGANTYTDTVVASDYYYYRVRAYSGTNYSPYSNEVVNVLPLYAYDGHTVARYDPVDVNGAIRDGAGVEDAYWDLMVGNATLGAEQASGDIVTYYIYRITACQANYFYNGCAVGDTFVCNVVKTCNANNKVRKYIGNHITQPVAANKPTNQVFDGAATFMSTGPLNYNQPSYVYMTVKQLSWTILDYLFTGVSGNNAIVQGMATPGLVAYGGANFSAQDGNLILNNWGIIRALFNDTTSKFIVDDNTPVTGVNWGNANMGGFRIGVNNYSNIEVGEIILRDIVESEDTENALWKYLTAKLIKRNIKGFLDKYDAKTVDANNQLNIVLSGDSILGRMSGTEIALHSGQAAGLFPPNMWQQNVAYKLLEKFQYSDADVKYYNLQAWTRTGTWALEKVTVDKLRIWQTDTAGDYAEIVITGASFFKMLYYTDAVVANEITITFNGVPPSVLGLTGVDTFDTMSVSTTFYKWYNVIWSGLNPATYYTVRITNTGGGTSQIWGCESWNNERINVINAAHGGYTAASHVATPQNFSGLVYAPDLIIHELPCLNDSYDAATSLGGKLHDAAAVSAVAGQFIYALDSGVFANYSNLNLTAGDYAEYDGVKWVAGSTWVTAALADFTTNLSYIDDIKTSAIPVIFITPPRATVDAYRPWLTSMRGILRTKLRTLGFAYLDFNQDCIDKSWPTTYYLSDGTHLNDAGVALYYNKIRQALG